MRTLTEWLKEKGIEGCEELSSSDSWMINVPDESIIENQLEQLVSRLEGLCHGLSENKKDEMIDRFMRQVEEKILGL